MRSEPFAVDAAVLDTLVYIRDVEGFTDRDLVGLTAHRSTLGDPLLRDFLEVWRREEAFHAHVLYRFLDGSLRHAASSPHRGSSHRPRSHRCGNGDPAHSEDRSGGWSPPPTWHGARPTSCSRSTATGCSPDAAVIRCCRPARRASPRRRRVAQLLSPAGRVAVDGESVARFALPRVLRRRGHRSGSATATSRRSSLHRVLRFLTDGHDGERPIDRMDRRFRALPGFGDLIIYRGHRSRVVTGFGDTRHAMRASSVTKKRVVGSAGAAVGRRGASSGGRCGP